MQLAQIFNQRERTPLETAIWSVEHVMQHGMFAVELLQSPGIELNWFIYHSLDSLAVLLVALLLIIAGWRALTQGQTPRKPRKSKKAKRS